MALGNVYVTMHATVNQIILDVCSNRYTQQQDGGKS